MNLPGGFMTLSGYSSIGAQGQPFQSLTIQGWVIAFVPIGGDPLGYPAALK